MPGVVSCFIELGFGNLGLSLTPFRGWCLQFPTIQLQASEAGKANRRIWLLSGLKEKDMLVLRQSWQVRVAGWVCWFGCLHLLLEPSGHCWHCEAFNCSELKACNQLPYGCCDNQTVDLRLLLAWFSELLPYKAFLSRCRRAGKGQLLGEGGARPSRLLFVSLFFERGFFPSLLATFWEGTEL